MLRTRLIELLDQLEGRNLSAQELSVAREALDLARHHGDEKLLGRALLCCGRAYYDAVGAFTECAALSIEAVTLYAGMRDKVGEAQAHYRLGAAYWRLRRFSEALLSLERSVAIAGEAGDPVRQIRSLNIIGVVHAYLGNYPRGFAAFDQALGLCPEEGFEIDRLLLLNNKAQNLLSRARATIDPDETARDVDMAFAILVPEAIALMEQWAPSYRRIVRDTVGQCLTMRRASRQALEIFEENLKLANAEDDVIGAANTRIGIAESLIDLGRPQETVDICTEILGQYGHRLHRDDVARGQLALSNAYRRLGRYDDALVAFLSYHDVVRSMSYDVVEQYSRHMTIALELEKSKAEAAAYKRLAEELRVAQETAEAASKAKSEFLSNMSHELRTPLNAIIGFADIMRGQMFGTIAPRYRAYLEDIHRSGQHLLELINQLLDLSKAEAGRLELSDEVIELDSLISDAAMLVRESALSSGVTLDTLPVSRVQVRVDPLRIKQCVINVLSNAVKFTPPGGTVSIAVEAEEKGVSITVTDTGIGLAPEDIAKAFERFGQGGNARAVTGTGLGLPLTKQLIELHGGSVDLTSKRGVGTTVVLRLPQDRIVAVETSKKPHQAA